MGTEEVAVEKPLSGKPTPDTLKWADAAKVSR
jgi:hypothetical protein